MTTIADKSEWVEDAELGVAVREVGADLHIRADYKRGHAAVKAAILASYEYGLSPPYNSTIGGWIVDAAHRLAFARALSPIEEPTVHNAAGQAICTACVKAFGSAVK